MTQEEYERKKAAKKSEIEAKIEAEKTVYKNLKSDLITIAAIKGQLQLSEENLEYANVQLGKASEKISTEKFNADKIQESAKECDVCKERTTENIKKIQDECAKLDEKNTMLNTLLEESTQRLNDLYVELACV